MARLRIQVVLARAAMVLIAISCASSQLRGELPRVFITTDIGINDPDDDQSVCHMLHFADSFTLVGLVPDLVVLRNNQQARKRLNDVIDAYQLDYENSKYRFQDSGHPSPAEVRSRIHWTMDDAVKAIAAAASADYDRPLYVLVWGRMQVIGKALEANPKIAKKIRLLTIATHLKANRSWGNEKGDGEERNWNWTEDRDNVFNAHPNLWWVESDWTYSGMFPAPVDDADRYGDPVLMRQKIKEHGRLGYHLWHIGNKHRWSGYFRCGDTPTLNYLLDPYDDDDPTQQGWAGRFLRPDAKRPNYYIGVHGEHEWDYSSPKRTWANSEKVFLARTATLRQKRKEMYEAYLDKLTYLYAKDSRGQ